MSGVGSGLNVIVPGTPVPQGSMKSFGPGQMVHSNATTLLPWRASVVAHLRAEMAQHGEWPIEGPVKVAITFTFARPKSAPRRMWPHTRPDIDKLARACLDCLGAKTGAGVIRDDAQVVMLGLTKAFGEPGMCLTLRAMAGDRVTAA